MKIVYVIGEPGSGKTTLMKRVMEESKVTKDIHSNENFPLVPFHTNNKNLIVLGKYAEGDVFGGTDKTSMAVQPQAIEFLKAIQKSSDNNINITAEGDRLTTASFIEHIVEEYDATIYYLRTTPDVRQVRYKERGSNQNETWLNGRITKIQNILTNFVVMNNVRRFDNNTLEDQQKVFDCIMKEIA